MRESKETHNDRENKPTEGGEGEGEQEEVKVKKAKKRKKNSRKDETWVKKGKMRRGTKTIGRTNRRRNRKRRRTRSKILESDIRRDRRRIVRKTKCWSGRERLEEYRNQDDRKNR